MRACLLPHLRGGFRRGLNPGQRSCLAQPWAFLLHAFGVPECGSGRGRRSPNCNDASGRSPPGAEPRAALVPRAALGFLASRLRRAGMRFGTGAAFTEL